MLIVPPLKDPEHQVATPAEERSDETPQELATRRLSASSAESVRLVWRIPYKYRNVFNYSFVYKLKNYSCLAVMVLPNTGVKI